MLLGFFLLAKNFSFQRGLRIAIWLALSASGTAAPLSEGVANRLSVQGVQSTCVGTAQRPVNIEPDKAYTHAGAQARTYKQPALTTRAHGRTRSRVTAHTRTQTCAHTHIRIHTHTYPCTHPCTHAPTHPPTLARMLVLASSNARMHARTHARTRRNATHANATHAPSLPRLFARGYQRAGAQSRSIARTRVSTDPCSKAAEHSRTTALANRRWRTERAKSCGCCSPRRGRCSTSWRATTARPSRCDPPVRTKPRCRVALSAAAQSLFRLLTWQCTAYTQRQF